MNKISKTRGSDELSDLTLSKMMGDKRPFPAIGTHHRTGSRAVVKSMLAKKEWFGDITAIFSRETTACIKSIAKTFEMWRFTVGEHSNLIADQSWTFCCRGLCCYRIWTFKGGHALCDLGRELLVGDLDKASLKWAY